MNKEIFRLVKDLSSNEQENLRNLNLGTRGYALNHINDAINNNCELTRVYTVYNSEQLIGWALLVPIITDNVFDKFGINFFVRDEYRKLGLGSHLFKVANNYLIETKQKGFVAIWSKDSELFYAKNKSDLIEVVVSPKYTLQLAD